MEIISLGDSALVLRVSRKLREQSGRGAASGPGSAGRVCSTPRCPGWWNAHRLTLCSAFFLIPLACDRRGAPEEESFRLDRRTDSRGSRTTVSREANRPETKIVEIPVCYEAEFALDLEEVAKHTRLSPMEIVRRHSAADYRVHCVGFMAGFPFLGGLLPELATPRRATPRKQVPAGSVAIGGVQTGVYPVALPGGWNVIGRTALRLFDAQREPPALLAAGSRVRFRAVTAQNSTLLLHDGDVFARRISHDRARSRSCRFSRQRRPGRRSFGSTRC